MVVLKNMYERKKLIIYMRIKCLFMYLFNFVGCEILWGFWIRKGYYGIFFIRFEILFVLLCDCFV